MAEKPVISTGAVKYCVHQLMYIIIESKYLHNIGGLSSGHLSFDKYAIRKRLYARKRGYHRKTLVELVHIPIRLPYIIDIEDQEFEPVHKVNPYAFFQLMKNI